MGGTGAYDALKDSDVVLEIEGQRVETFRDVEVAVSGKEQIKLLVVRDGEKRDIVLKTTPLGDCVTERVGLWCGAVLQTPPLAIAAQRGQPRVGVYVSSRFHGSPAAKFSLPPMARIVEVDGKEVTTLDDLLRIVAAKTDGDNVRIKHLDLRGAPSMTCLRIDTKYWPTTELRRMPGPKIAGRSEPYHWRRAAVHLDAQSDDVVF